MSLGNENHTEEQPSAAEEKPMLVIVMGVAGTGKSTLAKALNEKLGLPYIEGDDLHPKANIEKMSNGQPLTDEDREPWLQLIRTKAENILVEQQNDPAWNGKRKGVMVTCSALKKYYRDILRGKLKIGKVSPHLEPTDPATLPTYFVYIKEEEKLLRERMANRKGHFMKPNMLDSQLKTLERTEGEDGVVVVPLDATTEEQVEVAIEGLRKVAGRI
ncbi:carbohydrate kinase [Panus rudis PR-1116 ss-1]|nr:carbohydrate kinase [Panus rudis PR-1116 ss-1]